MLYSNHIINTAYSNMTSKGLLQLWAQIIGKPYGDRYLLSESVKTIKGTKKGYNTGVLYMTPAVRIGDVATCSHHKVGNCAGPCLVNSGHMALKGAIDARADRLQLLIKNPSLFYEILKRECEGLKRRSKLIRFRTAGRLNGTTDLDWTRILFNGKTIFQRIKGLKWYDYTKSPSLASNYQAAGISITFSWYRKADPINVLALLDRGVNIAIAYRDKLPTVQRILDRTVTVINGDDSDLRFRDQRGVVVGLKYKFATMSKNSAEINARALESGFIILSSEVIS